MSAMSFQARQCVSFSGSLLGCLRRNRREAWEAKQEELTSMAHRSRAHIHPAIEKASRIVVVQSNIQARTSGGFTALLEHVAQEILAVTFWFDPAPHQKPYPVTVRF